MVIHDSTDQIAHEHLRQQLRITLLFSVVQTFLSLAVMLIGSVFTDIALWYWFGTSVGFSLVLRGMEYVWLASSGIRPAANTENQTRVAVFLSQAHSILVCTGLLWYGAVHLGLPHAGWQNFGLFAVVAPYVGLRFVSLFTQSAPVGKWKVVQKLLQCTATTLTTLFIASVISCSVVSERRLVAEEAAFLVVVWVLAVIIPLVCWGVAFQRLPPHLDPGAS